MKKVMTNDLIQLKQLSIVHVNNKPTNYLITAIEH